MTDTKVCVDCYPLQEGSQDLQVRDAKADLLNPATFIAPDVSSESPRIVIQFCDRCRWLHRASWVSTELFLTFPSPTLRSISIIPLNSDETAGMFRVWLYLGGNAVLMWDRKVEGGFPELKHLKQRIRDKIQPDMSLGHSDSKSPK